MKQKALLSIGVGFVVTALLSGLSVFFLLDHVNPARVDTGGERPDARSTGSQSTTVVSTPSSSPVDPALIASKVNQQSVFAEVSNSDEPGPDDVDVASEVHHTTRVPALASPVEHPDIQPADFVRRTASLLEARFEAENYDPGWNDPLQEPLRRMFGETNLFAGTELVETSCQSTLCRVEFRHLEPGARDELLLTIVNDADFLPADLTDYFDYEIDATNSGDGVPRTVVFVARPGYPLRSTMSQRIPQG